MKPFLLGIGAMLVAAATSPAPPRLIDGAGAASLLPRHAIVLFWAAWCAPCRAEVRDYAALDKAAGDVPLIVLSTESGGRAQSLLSNVPPARRRFPADSATNILSAYPEARGALPFAMATGRDGRICATHAGAVDAAMIAAWRDRCSR